MTNTEINHFAQEAAQAAIDAYGLANPPSAVEAYSFIRQLDFDFENDPPMLRGREFRQFRHDYQRHLRTHGVALAMQTK